MDGLVQAAIFPIISTVFYAIIIYGNILLLFPRFYEKGYYTGYIISVIILLLAAGSLRGEDTVPSVPPVLNQPVAVGED